MINFIICSSTNFFRICLIRKFIQIFLGKSKQNKILESLAFGLFWAANTALFLRYHNVWINFTCNLFGISLLIFLYTKSLKTNLFVTCSIYLLNMGCDSVAVLLFVPYKIGKEFNQLYEIITVLLLLICEIITEKLINYREKTNTLPYLPLALVPLCSVITLCSMIHLAEWLYLELVITSIGLLFINFFVFYLYNLLLKAFAQIYENDMLKQKIKIYTNQLDLILQSEEKVKMLKHDMKHHINELKILSTKNDAEALQNYLNQMGTFLENTAEIISSGNKDTDSLLNYMLQKARKEDLDLHTKVLLPENIIHDFDVNIILGNLLENAIEAARQTEEKFLSIHISAKQGILKITVENSFSGIIPVRRNQLFSTKVPREDHGIGLSSVKNIINKHNGMMDITSQNSRFTVKIILYL